MASKVFDEPISEGFSLSVKDAMCGIRIRAALCEKALETLPKPYAAE